MKRLLALIERLTPLLVAVGMLVLTGLVVKVIAVEHANHVYAKANRGLLERVQRDEQNFISSGIPATTCLIDTFADVAPALSGIPHARAHLEAFLALQKHRYSDRICPSPKAARKLGKTLPRIH